MFIKISFKTPIFKNFKEIYFTPNFDIIYYDNSHLNYIYKETKDNLEYIFYGFFKDNYFTIICNSYDKNLEVDIENKNVILIKLKWITRKMFDNKLIYIIDETQIDNLKTECYILPIRNKFYSIQTSNLDDYMSICEYNTININIKVVNKILKNNLLQNIIKVIL